MFLISRRIGQLAFRRNAYLFGSALLAGTGSLSYYNHNHNLNNKASCENKIQQSTSSSSLVVPTIQASLRALRLVGTAIVIVVDYETAKLERFFPFTIQSKEEIRIKSLEADVERKERELEDAQMVYAREADKYDEKMATLTAEKQKQLKVEQKRRMIEAATKLAEAEEQLTSIEGLSSKSHLHRRSAERLLRLCRDNGGVYIKVGQHLANLDYLIPKEYIDVLSSLFDDAPTSKYEDVCKVIEEDLGHPIESLFERFEEVPIASASLAQVHIAYDKETKEKLAVKVQHRGLRETSAGDIYAVTAVVGMIDFLFKDFTFGWIAGKFLSLGFVSSTLHIFHSHLLSVLFFQIRFR